MCVLESGACGTIVAGNETGITPEFPECVTVPGERPGALAEAIVSLWQNTEERIQRSEAFAERIRRDFSIDDTVRSLLELYEHQLR